MAADTLERGRGAFARQAWAEAHDQLSAADEQSPLEPEDLERLATAAYLIGRDQDSADARARAHRELVSRGDSEGAARAAFWLGLHLLLRGETARGGGWISRAQRALGEHDSVVQGYLLVPAALQALAQGDAQAARAVCSRAADIGERFGEMDLVALGRLGRSQALIALGETAQGVALLDEVMVSVTAGEVSIPVAGIVYCAVIEACQEVFDVGRAQEWTAALTRWCDTQPDMVPYRGQCLVHRAEIMQLHGAWREAMEEARRAREQLAEPPGQQAVGMAFYQVAELHRLRGQLDKAEEAYRSASRHGREPEPGMALLRLAQGKVEAAAAAIRRMVDEVQDPVRRSKALPAQVEIMLAAGDVPAARAAADELAGLADDFDAPLLRAVSAYASGAVLLAEGDAKAALAALRRAATGWRAIEVPHEVARARVLIALACRGLGDRDSADLELEAARRAFAELGAGPDLARADELRQARASRAAGGLTAREVQVLGLVATGRTNKVIAEELFISERTVARHVSNIFAKLGVSSRSAATAYAYEHGLA